MKPFHEDPRFQALVSSGSLRPYVKECAEHLVKRSTFIHLSIGVMIQVGVGLSIMAFLPIFLGKAVQVDISLTPRVESAWFQLIQSTLLSKYITFKRNGFKCQPAPLQRGPVPSVGMHNRL